MNSLPSPDPLVALWQTAPEPDTHHLVKDLQRLNRLHRRLDRSILAILWGIAPLLLFEEATGRVPSHGVLAVIWIIGLVIGVGWRRRAQCNRSDALTLDTVSLLRAMIRQAKGDLFLARCLYAGVPGGALVGYVAMKFISIGTPSSAIPVNPNLHLIQTAAGVGVLIVMMATGATLSYSRRLQVKELTEKLKSFEDDL